MIKLGLILILHFVVIPFRVYHIMSPIFDLLIKKIVAGLNYLIYLGTRPTSLLTQIEKQKIF